MGQGVTHQQLTDKLAEPGLRGEGSGKHWSFPFTHTHTHAPPPHTHTYTHTHMNKATSVTAYDQASYKYMNSA